jgi:hypothetical protein
MQKYLNLLMGLVSGLALMLLNNKLALGSIDKICTLFDPTNISSIFIFLAEWLSRIVIFLSFIGNFITVVFAILILKRVLTK